MYSKIKTIKSNAKEQLLSHMWTAVFFTFLFYLLTNLCSFCLMVFPGSESILEEFRALCGNEGVVLKESKG